MRATTTSLGNPWGRAWAWIILTMSDVLYKPEVKKTREIPPKSLTLPSGISPGRVVDL